MRGKNYRQRAKAIALVLHNAEQRAVGLLVIFIAVFAILYTYFLGTAVVHAVERKEIQQQLAESSSRLADLEVDYLKGKSTITTSMAADLGFYTIAQKDYVERARYLGRADIQ